MRIVSDFHDYYDGVQSYGTDADLVFLRRSQHVSMVAEPNQKWDHPLARWLPLVQSARVAGLFTSRSEATACGGLLVVGGEGHVFLEANQNRHDKPTPNVFLWSFEQAVDWFEKNGRPLTSERAGFLHEPNERRRIEAFFKATPLDCSQALALTGAPLAILRGAPSHWSSRNEKASVELNPRLQETGFAAQMDAWTTFQKIAGFLGGVMLRPEPPMAVISDQSKVKKHGFDQLSFRRPPGLPKRRKNKAATSG